MIISTLGEAIAIAADCHKDQKTWQDEPYITHPLRVMKSLQDFYNINFRNIQYPIHYYEMVAVLHDVFEDKLNFSSINDFTFPNIGKCQGIEVNKALEAVTRQDKETYRQYFDRCVNNPIARVVKYYDTLDNMDPKRYHPNAPYNRYLTNLNWFYENGL